MPDLAELQSEISYLTKKLETKLHAVVSVSNRLGKVIVTARASTQRRGILYEHEWFRVLPYADSSEALGVCVLEALSQYRIEARDLSRYTAADWPSYRASKLPSMKAFEASFTSIEVEAWENGMLHLVGSPVGESDVKVTATIGSKDPQALGDRIFQIALCCNALVELNLT